MLKPTNHGHYHFGSAYSCGLKHHKQIKNNLQPKSYATESGWAEGGKLWQE